MTRVVIFSHIIKHICVLDNRAWSEWIRAYAYFNRLSAAGIVSRIMRKATGRKRLSCSQALVERPISTRNKSASPVHRACIGVYPRIDNFPKWSLAEGWIVRRRILEPFPRGCQVRHIHGQANQFRAHLTQLQKSS